MHRSPDPASAHMHPRASRLAGFGMAAWCFAAAIAALSPHAWAQQAFPNRQITITAPIPAGGSTDRLVRQVAQSLARRFGQPVVVENRPGGSSSIGTAFVAKAPPDGYSLVLVNGSHAINPHVIPKLPFDAIRDFTPVVHMTSLSMGLFVNPALPAKTLADFIAMAKAKPDSLSYASAGNGGVGHLTGEMFKQAAGVAMQHVPYRGSAPALTDAIGGQVPAIFTDAPLVNPHVKAGRLRALAIAAKQRSAVMPAVPTFTESGVPNMDIAIWIGLLAPANTPADVINVLNREIVAILREPAMTADLNAQGFEVVGSTPEEFAKSIRDDFAAFGAIVRSANIRAD